MFLPSDAKTTLPTFQWDIAGELGAITVLRRRRLRLAFYSGLRRRWFCLILPLCVHPRHQASIAPKRGRC